MTTANGAGAQSVNPARVPFPFVRLLYAAAFGVLAWFTFSLTLALAIVQFAVLGLTGRQNEELRSFSLRLVQYLWELLAFISFVRDEQPFPIGPFPKA
jgi:hypothetical protein